MPRIERTERWISALYCTAASKVQLGSTLVEPSSSKSENFWSTGALAEGTSLGVLRDDGTQWIINRDNNTWERTDTDGFTAWMKAQDTIANKHLREVIRIGQDFEFGRCSGHELLRMPGRIGRPNAERLISIC